jgi:hypothetical protein
MGIFHILNIAEECKKILLLLLRRFDNKQYQPILDARGCIFSHVRPFYEQAVSDLDRSMHRSL